MNVHFTGLKNTIGIAVAVLTVTLCHITATAEQTSAISNPPIHYNNEGIRSPGFLGQERLHMGGPVEGYYQPVMITGPRGAQIAMTYMGEFTPFKSMPNTVGLLIGKVYRFRISNFPILDAQGTELFPTLEVIDRIYAPQGKEVQHPIVVEITIQDIKDAISGSMVTKVIYLEDPNNPTPTVNAPNGHQASMDVSARVNPVAVADALGRPVAILRIGGRVPIQTPDGRLSDEFQFGSPSFIDFNTSVPQPRKSITNYPVKEQTPVTQKGKTAGNQKVPATNLAPQAPQTPQKQDKEQFDNIEF